MYSFESIDLGRYRGNDYFLKGFVEPDPSVREVDDPDEDADNYGVALVQAEDGQTDANVQIVRMDTAHGQPHMDLEYLPPDTDKQRKEWLDEGYTYERMKQFLLTHWETFVDLYIQYDEQDGTARPP